MARAYVEYPLSGEHGAGLVTKVDLDVAEWLDGKSVHLHSGGYAQILPRGAKTGDSPQRLHRQIMRLVTGDGLQVDHINRDRLDNRRENLRVGTPKLNRANLGSRRGPFTKGVTSLPNGRFRANVTYNGVNNYLGTFDSRRTAWSVAEKWRRENIVGYVPQES